MVVLFSSLRLEIMEGRRKIPVDRDQTFSRDLLLSSLVMVEYLRGVGGDLLQTHQISLSGSICHTSPGNPKKKYCLHVSVNIGVCH